MRIKSIKIAWFRGSSDPAELVVDGDSFVIYGENGSGKSSFVDAIEYTIQNGKIRHLTHEYSGRRQEKAILNTHIPGSKNGEITITLEDNSVIAVKILKNGNFSISPETSAVSVWDYRKTILRQNELADFITDTKLDKYSALLPLLGLGHLEIAAENLRRVRRRISEISRFEQKEGEISRSIEEKSSIFGNCSDEEIYEELGALYRKYGGKEPKDIDKKILPAETLKMLEGKLGKLSDEYKTYSQILELSKIDVDAISTKTQVSAAKLGASAMPLISEKLRVLSAAREFALKSDGTEIQCPACGREILTKDFVAHISNEELILKEITGDYAQHNKNIGQLSDSLFSIQRTISSPHLQQWIGLQNPGFIKFIQDLDISAIRDRYTPELHTQIIANVTPLLIAAKSEADKVPMDFKEMDADKEKILTANTYFKIEGLKSSLDKIRKLLSVIDSLEKQYREQIRTQSSAIVGSISADIARMWGILHPNELIEDIRLSLPDDVDKAVEIRLKFYGIEQDSPRLTLSEGHRNSLGLCIFLAMAKKDETDAPIILDDVVVSFDRGHRGSVGTLLEQEFSERQVILFTHERDWYIELRKYLVGGGWSFKNLLPWVSPEVGIRFSTRQYGFDDARAQLQNTPPNPDSAANTARKTMDTSLAVLADGLKLQLPYLYMEKNDARTAPEFLSKIISLSNSLQIRDQAGNYVPFSDAYTILKEALRLLSITGNRGSHTFNVTEPEAIELINSCEEALLQFTCTECCKMVTFAEQSSTGIKQCSCGHLRWKC